MSKKALKGNGQDKDLTKEREKEIIPVAEQVLEIIAGASLPTGDVHAHDNVKYDAVAKEILELLLQYDIKYVDANFLFQLVMQPIDRVREQVSLSLKRSLDNAVDKALQKEFREVRLSDLNRILKNQ